MKYTLISKTGKVADLQVTLEEALPALRARYGDNGRAIIRELLALVAAHSRPPLSRRETRLRTRLTKRTPAPWMAGLRVLYRHSSPLSVDELFALAAAGDGDAYERATAPMVAGRDFCHYCGIEGDDNTLCQSTGCCQNCLDAGR